MAQLTEHPAEDPKRLDDLEGEAAISAIHTALHRLVYTDPAQARALLQRQAGLLTEFDEELFDLEEETGLDYRLWLHLHRAIVENQEYRLEASGQAFDAALARAEADADIADKLEVYLAYIGYLSNCHRTEQAIDYLERCQRLLEGYPSAQLSARLACRHGFIYLLVFSYPKATLKFLEAERLLNGGEFELTPQDHYIYSLTQSGLGMVYQHSGKSGLALQAFQRAIERCELIGLRARLPWHQLNLGKELTSREKYAEAVGYFRAVVDSKANGSTEALAAAYANLGYCYHYLGQPDRANTYVDQAESLYRGEEKTDHRELANLGFMRATFLMDDGAWAASIKQLNRMLNLLDTEGDISDPQLLSMIADAYLYLSMAHSELGDFEMAYRHHCTYDHYNHRFHAQVDIQRQQQFAAQFRAEAREQENRQLKLRASQLKLKALRAQMNPHFLYNALNSIQSFISTNNAKTASKHLAKFARLMRRSLEYANREYISLEEERQFLEDYLDINQHLRFEGQLTYDIRIHPDLEEDIISVPTMILQPYVENAIEHGLRGRESGHISVRFEPEGDDLLLATVSDDGIGRAAVRERQAKDPSRIHHQSRGTQITESRLQLLSPADREWVRIIDLQDAAGRASGTEVRVLIPVAEIMPRRILPLA